MKKLYICALAAAVGTLSAGATRYVCDFESYPIGHQFKMFNQYGDAITSTAVVEADPKNPNNKVLHVTNQNWNEFVTIQLPAELGGTKFNENFMYLNFDLYRPANDPVQEWKQFKSLLGNQVLVETGFDSVGGTESWSTKGYTFNSVSEGNTSCDFHLGFNSDKSEYYLDNITLKGRWDDYVVVEGGKLDIFNAGSSSSNYTKYSTPLNIPAGTSLDVYTSRYTWWSSNIIGSGTLNIYGGGERSYIAADKNVMPDWTYFSGDVHIYPYDKGLNCGSYGVVLPTANKKYDPTKVQESIVRRRIGTLWENNKVTLHAGAWLAGESNSQARAHRIGRLYTEPGSTLTGYYKSNDYRVAYIVGCDNSDSELAGTVTGTRTEIIKEGLGTYSISGNNNNITGGLTVIGGRVLLTNDVEAARASKLPGAVGTAQNSRPAVTVIPGGTLGGNGHIGGLAEIYGQVEPGTPVAPATLTVADFKGGLNLTFRVHPTARLLMKVNSATVYDKLVIEGDINYSNKTLGLQTVDAKPVLEIVVPEGHNLKAGDKFTLISAKKRTSIDNSDWAFRIQYPKVCTWKVTETAAADGTYTLTAEVTSLTYTGQGEKTEDTYVEAGEDDSIYYVDYSADRTDTTPLATYATRAGKRIGVAATAWRGYDLSNDNDNITKVITREFNMIEPENELKFEPTEPTEGVFTYGDADKIVNYAIGKGKYVRGHALVWHTQNPSWVSSDGKKNDRNWTRDGLLKVMKNHIDNVAARYKDQIGEWDVVNEMLSDDQTAVLQNPNVYTLRKESVWNLAIGADYIEKALEYAHAAAPNCKLFINEYGAEYLGDAKSEALYNLAKTLKAKGVPLHGVGLQCHLTSGVVRASKLAANIRRYQDLGLEVCITELDIAQTGVADAAEVQAVEYGALVNAALSQPNCTGVLVWGISDAHTWIGADKKPLLYDENMQPKEAYYAVKAAFRLAAERSGIEEVIADKAATEVVATEYYNIQGIRVSPDTKGLVIKRTLRADGSATSEKVIR